MRFIVRLVLLLFSILFASGCQVTEEKIELWKGTQNGPKKLAGTLIDPDVSIELRAKAAVALVEIKELDLFQEAFQKMEKADSQQLISQAAPILGSMIGGDAGLDENSLTPTQVDAKDGLYLMLDFADGASRDAVVQPLVRWCSSGNFNIRAMAGSYNAQAIAKKLGGPAAMGMADVLVMNQRAIEPISKLIKDIGDAAALEKASARISAELMANIDKVEEVHLVSAAIIGGAPVADMLLAMATNKGLSPELQRFALRAFSMSLETGGLQATQAQVDILFTMAENREYDQYQREETYLTIAQAARKEDAERMSKLLLEDNFFWRLTGLRCLLRMDGEGWLEKALTTKKLAREASEVGEIVEWTSKFPGLADTFRALLGNKSAMVKGVAIYSLGVTGDKAKDVPLLQKLSSSGTKLPAGFKHATVGEAAAFAVAELDKKG